MRSLMIIATAMAALATVPAQATTIITDTFYGTVSGGTFGRLPLGDQILERRSLRRSLFRAEELD